jgi:O-antigen ligase/tetratricopeptide (TPR) repeat protein
MFAVAFCGLLIAWCLCLSSAMSGRCLPVALVPLGLALIMAACQTVSLSPGFHRFVSPTTLGWWDQLASSRPKSVVEESSTGYPISLYPASTRRELYMLTLAAATFLLAALVVADRFALAVAGAAVALNGAALAFFGLVQQLTWNGRLFWSIPLTDGGVPFASYVNRNNAAGLLNMCLACAIGLTVWGLVYRSFRVRRRHLIQADSVAARAGGVVITAVLLPLARLNFATGVGLTAAACMVAGVFSSLSRGGTVALAAASAITLVAAALAGRWRHSWLGPVLLPIVLGVLLVAYVDRSDSVIQRASTVLDDEVRRADGRWEIWADGWKAATDLLPTGSGLGTFRHVYRLYQQQPSGAWFYHAENQYLQTLVEAGLPGAALLMGTLGLVALACWRLLRADDPASYALGIAGTFALASQAVHALFDFGLYLPANMLLLALICGAVCGRAARLVHCKEPAGREHRPWSDWWVALPPSRPLAASYCVALAGLLLLGIGHACRAAASREALDAAKSLDLDRFQTLDKLDWAITQLTPISAAGQDAVVHLQLARLWTARMRSVLFESLREDPAMQQATDAVRWAATDTNYLYGLVQQWTAQQRFAETAALRGTAAVPENLPNAIWHLRAARSQCPLLPEVHGMLAELTVLVQENADNQQHLRRVRLTAPARPEVLTRCGWLELQAGRIDLACQTWKQSLSMDPQQFPTILGVARSNFDLAWNIGRLLPDSPEWILDVAVDYFGVESDRPVRRALLDRAQQLIVSQDPYSARTAWLLGRVALLRNDSRQAVSHLSRALTLEPENTAWRYELAVALKQAGRYLEAQEQARICVQIQPDNARYETLLREVTRARTARRGS